ncbi:hypothetical protein CRG98_016924 [Punica granatum]|uniref:Secreted protein n=1 Tax=Punica granatum TaxID=22663 RepID=A0A2I0K3F8_PUNGR|nr:hypothetical protein CRG98_016924 [Punica granatum]
MISLAINASFLALWFTLNSGDPWDEPNDASHYPAICSAPSMWSTANLGLRGNACRQTSTNISALWYFSVHVLRPSHVFLLAPFFTSRPIWYRPSWLLSTWSTMSSASCTLLAPQLLKSDLRSLTHSEG